MAACGGECKMRAMNRVDTVVGTQQRQVCKRHFVYLECLRTFTVLEICDE